MINLEEMTRGKSIDSILDNYLTTRLSAPAFDINVNIDVENALRARDFAMEASAANKNSSGFKMNA